MMFTNPPVRKKPKEAGAPAESTRRTKLNHEITSLARRVLDQYRGDLRDSEGNPQTLTINEAYSFLQEMAKVLDLDMPASEYRALFDNEFVKIVRTETGSNEAARFVATLLQNPLIENTPEAQNVTGYRSKTGDQHPLDPRQKAAVTALNDEYFDQVLNVIAGVGLLPGNRKELNQTIDSLRQVYTGSLTKILFDTSVAKGSGSTVTDTGNNNSLAQWLQAVESTPAAHIPSRVEGGSTSSSTMNDTTAARKQQADAYMRTALEGKGIQVIDTNRDGKYVTATDSKGNAYRIRSEKRTVAGSLDASGRPRMQQRDVIFIEQRNKGETTGTDSEWIEIYTNAELSGSQKVLSRGIDALTSSPPGSIPNRDYLPKVSPPRWPWSRK
jgi:hypothetical protein